MSWDNQKILNIKTQESPKVDHSITVQNSVKQIIIP